MVSTRKVKDKFSEGDRVLCYEPDPTKTKVLYDSKVLEVKNRKDERGRRIVEYLIHFKGWNSSWDRVVNEDFILKDTDENRQLQKDLAAKARLQIGVYLYRKEQSDGPKLSDETFDHARARESETAEDDWVTASDDDGDDIASSVETDDSLDQKVPLELTPAIRMFLETDFDLVKRRNKLVKLPASPNVVEILEAYIRHMASRVFRTNGEASPRPRGRGQSMTSMLPGNKADELVWVTAKMNVAKEVVDGLRICFDFYLPSQLLYASEVNQYEQVKMGLFQQEISRELKAAVFSEDETSKSDDPFISSKSGNVQLATEPADVERRRSLRSHKDSACEASGSAAANGLTVKSFAALDRLILRTNQTSVNNSSSAKSCSSASSYCGPLVDGAHLAGGGGPLAPEMAQLTKLAESWRLVPDSYLQQHPPHPSAVYGIVHLCRLLVRLPSIIYASNLPDKENQPRYLSEQKLKLLLNHLQSFITYLEGKCEWFGEHQYYQHST